MRRSTWEPYSTGALGDGRMANRFSEPVQRQRSESDFMSTPDSKGHRRGAFKDVHRLVLQDKDVLMYGEMRDNGGPVTRCKSGWSDQRWAETR
jgi:hypothetical protein